MGYDYRMPCGEQEAPDERGNTGTSVTQDPWKPVVTAVAESPKQIPALRGKKYGHGLKAFDLNETVHIIDYAILTGAELVFEYAGSPLIGKGNYTVLPVTCSRSKEPILEGTAQTGRKKCFLVRRISRIGVGVS
jgi:hypothetical protein